MYTAMLTAENIARGTKHDVWSVNVEEEYHEEAAKTGDDLTPRHARYGSRRAGDPACALRSGASGQQAGEDARRRVSGKQAEHRKSAIASERLSAEGLPGLRKAPPASSGPLPEPLRQPDPVQLPAAGIGTPIPTKVPRPHAVEAGVARPAEVDRSP